jgi:hypothetical protein
MAYNYNFPVGYQNYYPQYQQGYVQQPQTQNNGFIRVQNENEARMYPVAPGNSLIFIDENAPFCYTKTVDTSQLDRPKFEKYRLVKEEHEEQDPSTNLYVSSDDFELLKKEVEKIKEDLNQRISIENRQMSEIDH